VALNPQNDCPYALVREKENGLERHNLYKIDTTQEHATHYETKIGRLNCGSVYPLQMKWVKDCLYVSSPHYVYVYESKPFLRRQRRVQLDDSLDEYALAVTRNGCLVLAERQTGVVHVQCVPDDFTTLVPWSRPGPSWRAEHIVVLSCGRILGLDYDSARLYLWERDGTFLGRTHESGFRRLESDVYDCIYAWTVRTMYVYRF
jgi:hypothetical protein